MEFEDLTLGQMLALCRRAEQACSKRFAQLALEADPADRPLQRLLGELQAAEHRHEEAVRRFADDRGLALDGALDREIADRLLKNRFPSVFKGCGEGHLDRDIAMYLAECVEEEASGFYRALADAAPDEESRFFFQKVALGEWGHLEKLRTVLL